MTMKHRRDYHIRFEVEFYGTRRKRTLMGIEEVPYVFSLLDDGQLCMPYIEANTPIWANKVAEKRIRENAQRIVNQLARKTIKKESPTIFGKCPDGNYKTSKGFYSIKGYRIVELLVT